LFLAIVSADTKAKHDVNSVFLMRSSDDGVTWRPPALVSRSGSNPAHSLKVRIGPAASVHLVWIQTLPDRQRRVLRHVVSQDAGNSWSSEADLEPIGELEASQVAVDECRRVHVVYETRHVNDGTMHLNYAVWDGRWSEPKVMFPSFNATGASLRLLPDGRLVVVFLAQPVNAPSTQAPVSLYSELPPG
jgi:hypothetical protein